MSGRGRKAVLPPADFQAAERLALNGLQVTVINKDGYGRVFDFAKMPVPEPMRRSLARLYADQSLAWHSHASGLAYWQSLLVFARFLEVQGQPAQDLEDLTAATLKLWRNNHKDTPGGREAMAKMRTLLNQDPRLARGPAAEELARPVPNKGKISGKSSYKPSERAAVMLAAERCFRPALLRIRENTALLGRFRAGELTEGTVEWQVSQLLQHIATTGDIPRLTHGKIPGSSRVLLGGTTRVYTWGRLFLTRRELTSLAVLMTDRFGWNHSTYNRLPVPVTTASVGEATTVTYTVTIEKRRRGSGRWFDTENHTDSGADSPGRLITLALEATQHARAMGAVIAPGVDLLMVARLHSPGRPDSDLDQPRPVWPLSFGVTKADARRWATSHGVGSPFRRSRRTAVVREGKPLQHSRGTHESVYVLPDRNVQQGAVEVIAAGAEAALQQAREYTFKGQLATFADPEHQETATADCADERSTPWPGPDGGCGADFLLCLACENARVHHGHHPRLALLHRQLIAMRSAWPEELWRKRWDQHLQRLTDLRSKVNETAWDAALSRATDRDREIIDHVFRGELTP
ncbi:hypothetical protein [Streptacidiphilus jiangxiensis]|uniref:Uncharacterized protein n=1 Tax=Streptacidiphilus jiangxiensis TaxID=235985 RepID=A0A1H7H275_STRJI|nr:hypothetical protein [Streptacidiphilus jiangxiensis]SEK43847.1 hypothetical protein SAMN05414137_10228 [Streptacidiphilus jiangxiensis]